METEHLPSCSTAYRITAVVSAFNSEAFMAERLRNLCEQSLCRRGELEIVVVDSASEQNERGIAARYRTSCPHIAYVRTARRETVYGAWNRGLGHAKGRYFINANADDRFAPGALERMATALDRDPAADAAYGDWLCTNTPNDTWDGEAAKGLFEYPAWHPPLLFYLQLTSHAAMVRRSVFDRIGLYDERMEVYGDREFIFRFAAAGHLAVKIEEPVGLYYENPASIVRREALKGERENVALTRACFAPDKLARLWGRDAAALDRRERARLYADTGALGLDLAEFDGLPRSFPDLATAFLTRALELDPDNVAALNNQAVIDCAAGRFAKGAPRLERARRLVGDRYPPTVIVHNLTLARREAADHAAYRPIRPPHDPGRLRFRQIDTPVAMSVKAIRALDACRTEEAIGIARKIIERNPRAAHSHTLLGMALWRRGDHVEALHHFTRSLGLCPTSRMAVLNCGAALTHLDRPAEALRLYEALARVHPDDPEVRARLGR